MQIFGHSPNLLKLHLPKVSLYNYYGSALLNVEVYGHVCQIVKVRGMKSWIAEFMLKIRMLSQVNAATRKVCDFHAHDAAKDSSQPARSPHVEMKPDKNKFSELLSVFKKGKR